MTDIGPGEYWAATIWHGRATGQPTTSGRARGAYRAPDLRSVWTGSVERFENRQTSSRSFQSGPMSIGLRSQPNQTFHYTA